MHNSTKMLQRNAKRDGRSTGNAWHMMLRDVGRCVRGLLDMIGRWNASVSDGWSQGFIERSGAKS